MSAGSPKRVAQYSISGDHADVADVARARSAGATIAAEDLHSVARLGLDGGELPRRGEFLGRVLCNRYLIEDVLLEGPAGLTCRAYHLSLDQPVLLRATPTTPDPGGESWLSDAPCALRSRYLLNTLEVGRLKEGWNLFVTDHPKDSALTPLELVRDRLTIRGTVTLGRQLAMALDAAHRAGISHGDLKLDDVFIADAGTRTERVLLVGFGVLRAMVLSLPPVNSGIFRLDGDGPAPPVQAPLPEACDDVYALGVILRELAHALSQALDSAAARRRSTRPAAQNAILSGLSLIVETCLIPTPGVPPPSAWEVARDLARLEVGSRGMLPEAPDEPARMPAASAGAASAGAANAGAAYVDEPSAEDASAEELTIEELADDDAGDGRPSVIVHRPHPRQQIDETLPKVIISEPPSKK
jgi:hypothetical protein